MDRQAVPAPVDDKKTSTNHRPVLLHRLSDLQVSPRGRVNPTFRTVSRECSVQSTPPAMSPPYLGPSLVTVTLFKGVFFKPEDFETGFASPSQPQQVAQDQANGPSPLSSTDTLMDSNRFPSSTVTPLSLPSTSTHHNHQEVISYNESQPSANGPTGKRKLCEIENEVEEDDDDDCDEWIESDQENEDLFPAVKKPRMDTTRSDSAQPMVVRQSVRPAEYVQQKQVNKQDGQVITLALHCPEQWRSQTKLGLGAPPHISVS